jgi:hypothetical protein
MKTALVIALVVSSCGGGTSSDEPTESCPVESFWVGCLNPDRDKEKSAAKESAVPSVETAAATFEGIQKVLYGDDGHTLLWDPMPYPHNKYLVYAYPAGTSLDVSRPAALVDERNEHLYPHNKLAEDGVCFVVRLNSGIYDQNRKSICVSSHFQR